MPVESSYCKILLYDLDRDNVAELSIIQSLEMLPYIANIKATFQRPKIKGKLDFVSLGIN